MNDEKRELRRKYLAARAQMKSEEKDRALAARFLSSPFAQAESFFVYLSYRDEADTHFLVGELLVRGKRVCCPRTEGREMRSVRYRLPLERDRFGILQPPEGEEETCAVALVPLLAADETGIRLGYGGGYYDRYLSAHPEIVRVGYAYGGQAAAKLPAEDTDVPLDALVTDERVVVFRPDRVKIK